MHDICSEQFFTAYSILCRPISKYTSIKIIPDYHMYTQLRANYKASMNIYQDFY